MGYSKEKTSGPSNYSSSSYNARDGSEKPYRVDDPLSEIQRLREHISTLWSQMDQLERKNSALRRKTEQMEQLENENFRFKGGIQDITFLLSEIKKDPDPSKKAVVRLQEELIATINNLMAMGGVQRQGEESDNKTHSGQSEKKDHNGQNPSVDEVFDGEYETKSDEGYHSGPRPRSEENSDSETEVIPAHINSRWDARTEKIATNAQKDDRNTERRAMNDENFYSGRGGRSGETHQNGRRTGTKDMKSGVRKDDRNSDRGARNEESYNQRQSRDGQPFYNGRSTRPDNNERRVREDDYYTRRSTRNYDESYSDRGASSRQRNQDGRITGAEKNGRRVRKEARDSEGRPVHYLPTETLDTGVPEKHYEKNLASGKNLK